jgi:hypothetical protein
MSEFTEEKEQKYRDMLLKCDEELLLLRSILVKIKNIASGRDFDLNETDIISLCNYGLDKAFRALGREV